MEIQNANPTILTNLPTREPAVTKQPKGPRIRLGHDFDDVLYAQPAYYNTEFGSDDPWLPGEEGQVAEELLLDEPVDEQEIYDLISNISDPEHPFSLGQLAVVNLPDIRIDPPPSLGVPSHDRLVYVRVDITPTVSHCSHATIIGLAVRVRLERVLPPNFRVDVRMRQGTHAQDDQVTAQLADKERVAAAMENETLMGVLDTMLKGCEGTRVG